MRSLHSHHNKPVVKESNLNIIIINSGAIATEKQGESAVDRWQQK